MSLWEILIGPAAVAAVVLALAVYGWSVVAREHDGGGERVVTRPTMRPILITALVLAAVIGVALLLVRLGTLS